MGVSFGRLQFSNEKMSQRDGLIDFFLQRDLAQGKALTSGFNPGLCTHL
jgi:hypothetical protein